MTFSPRAAGLATLTVAVLALSACSGSDHKKPTETPTPTTPVTSSTPSSTATTAAPKPAVKLVNPLTGLGAPPKGPVIAVKIDDTAPGRPQRGINQADIVYIEEAEGGLSRLAAIFDTHKPVAGYVRSTRPSDPDLFLQFGKITEVASGGGHDALPLLDRSGIKGWINDRGAAYYSRQSHSGDHGYINLVIDLAKVSQHAKTPSVRGIGWTWNANVKSLPASSIATDVRTRVGSSQVEFRYNYRTKLYTRYIDGVRQVDSSGQPVTTSNVIVQVCKIVPHPQDTDVNGNPSQFTYTTGTGKVFVFRNGHRVNGTWSRPHLDSGTQLLDGTGHNIPLNPGKTWVALIRPGASVTGT